MAGIPDPQTEEAAARRRAQVVQWRLVGMTFEQIGQRFDPPITRQTAHRLWRDAMRRIVADDVEELRKLEDQRLDLLITQAVTIMRAKHPLLHMGAQVFIENVATGQRTGLEDHGPVLAAIATLQRLSESKRKLWGVDMPAKLEVAPGMSTLDKALEDLKAELAAMPVPADMDGHGQVREPSRDELG